MQFSDASHLNGNNSTLQNMLNAQLALPAFINCLIPIITNMAKTMHACY